MPWHFGCAADPYYAETALRHEAGLAVPASLRHDLGLPVILAWIGGASALLGGLTLTIVFMS